MQSEKKWLNDSKTRMTHFTVKNQLLAIQQTKSCSRYSVKNNTNIKMSQKPSHYSAGMDVVLMRLFWWWGGGGLRGLG